MTLRIAGPGQGVTVNQFLYPSELNSAPPDFGGNEVSLAAGTALPVPAGDWVVDPGLYSFLQFYNPQVGAYWEFNSDRGQPQHVLSNGWNWRVANLTGCPIAGLVTVGGTGYPVGATTITSNTGGSTWAAIVGGAITTSTLTSTSTSQLGGLGYGIAPLLLIGPPAAPGFQATGYTTISNTTVSGVSLINQGAGYTGTTLAALIVPSPFDPSLATGITQATCYFNLGYNGQVTGAVCTNNGAPASPTLTVTGTGGANATVIAVNLSTITGISVTSGGAGFPNLNTMLTTSSGRPAATPLLNNPSYQLTTFFPRQAQLVINSTSAGVVSVATVIDGGLFAGTPNVILATEGAPTSAATIGLTLSSTQDTITLQSL